jgi:hypothetical protein
MNNWCICWFYTHFLLRISIFKRTLTARSLYALFGVNGLTNVMCRCTCLSVISLRGKTHFMFVKMLTVKDRPPLQYNILFMLL